MADLNAVYKALEKAHAAGDTESAKTLADYIRSQASVAEEAAPESSVQDVTQQQKDLTQAPSSAVRRYIADPALGLAKGVVGAGEAVIGLADIPTMGLAGKAADAIEKRIFGGTTKDLQAKLQALKTPEEQQQEQAVAEAKGFKNTVGALAQNPAAFLNILTESLPSMVGGAGLARKVLGVGGKKIATMVGKKAAGTVAGAAGEGAITAGSIAEQTRQQQEDGLLSPKQAVIATGSGVLTGGFGLLGGRVAQKLGFDDLDTLMVGGAAQAEKKNALTAAFKSALSEATLEELPQSIQEQIAQNLSNDKPWDEGVAEAAATGALAGFAMAGGFTGVRQMNINRQIDKAVDDKKDEVIEPAGAEEKRASRDTIIKSTFNTLNTKAKDIQAAKQQAQDDAKAAEVEQEVNKVEPTEPGVLDETTLTSWGLSPRSNAYKALVGQDIKTPEGLDIMNKTLEVHTGKINEKAVDAYLKGVPDAGSISRAARTSNEILGGLDDGSTKGAQGRVGSAADISGSAAGITETGEKGVDTTLKTPGTTYDRTKTAPAPGYIWAETTKPDGTTSAGWVKDPEAPESTEVLKSEKELTTEPEVKSEEVKAMNRMGKLLQTLDPTNPLIESLQNGVASETDISTAHDTIQELQQSRKAKKVDLSKAAPEEEELPTSFEGTLEGKAIVNTTKPAKTMGQALTILKQQHFEKLNPVEKVLHEVLSKIQNVTKGRYHIMGLGKNKYGSYSPTNNKTIISPDAGTNAIFHEGTHAATAWEIKKHVKTKNGKMRGVDDVGRKMVAIFTSAQDAARAQGKDFGHAFDNMEEFIAEAFNTADFQRFLADQPSVAPSETTLTSLWTDFLSAVKDLLKLGDISDTLLSDIIGVAPDLFTGYRPENLAAFPAVEPLYQRMSEKDLDKQADDAGNKAAVKVEPVTVWKEFKSQPVQTLPKIMNMIRSNLFSFDTSINKKILEAMRKAGVIPEKLAKAYYMLQVSQAVKSDQIADLFLKHGNIKYNSNLFKFEVTDAKDSMIAIRNKIEALAKKNGYPVNKMFVYASQAFIARRSQGLMDANKQLEKDVLKLLTQNKTKQAKERLKNNYKLVHLTPAQIKKGEKFFTQFPELEDIADTWNGVRRKVLNLAKDSGLYNEEQVEELLNVMDYVPFYRDAQIEAGKATKEYPRGLLDAATDKRLKGSYQSVNNVFDNMERWTRYIVRKSINNTAAQAKIGLYSNYVPNDIKVLKKEGRSTTGNTVNIWQDGKLVRYEFQGNDGESMVGGFTGLEPVMLTGLKGFFRPYANFLRLNIVLQPIFSIAQIPMDSFNAMFTSGVKYPLAIPLQVMKEIVLTPLHQSTAREELKRTGTVGKHDFSSEYERIDLQAAQEAKKYKTLDKLLKAVMHPLEMLSMASDNVIRQAVYAQTVAETGDKARAVHVAEEIINFRRTGTNQFINIMRQNAPFVNANLQALHVAFSTIMNDGITPDAKSDAFKRFWLTAGQVMLLSFAYAAMGADDDKYKELDPSERDRFLLMFGADGFKIPLRNDIFTLFFKTVPEHIYNTMIAESQDSEKFKTAMARGLKRALATPSAIPTLLTPLVESAYNIDLVTGRPLIGQGQSNLEPELQFSPKYTSELAKTIGDFSGLAPIQVDHFMNRYFGTTAGLLGLMTTSMLARSRGDILPEQSIREVFLKLPSSGSFLAREHGSRNVTDFYELAEIVDKAVQSANKFKGLDYNKYQEYIDKDNNRELVIMQGEMRRISDQLSLLRSHENKILASRDAERYTPASKKEQLERIEKRRQDLLGHQLKVRGTMDRYIQQLRYRGGL